MHWPVAWPSNEIPLNTAHNAANGMTAKSHLLYLLKHLVWQILELSYCIALYNGEDVDDIPLQKTCKKRTFITTISRYLFI